MLGLVALESWHIIGLNVWNAYFYSKLDEEIYLE